MLTVGLLISNTNDPYNRDVIAGCTRALADSGARLVCLTSGAYQARNGFDAQRNVLIELVDGRELDGLILSGTISHMVGTKEVLSLCGRFSTLPLVSMSVWIPGITSVVADNAKGFRELLSHLIADHGYDSFCFVGGPRGQQEADLRYALFREALEHSRISFRDDRAEFGDFTRESGFLAAERLCDRLKARPGYSPFRGIVCANDSIALGVMDFLADRGWNIPGDCFVTGFDNHPEGRSSTPSLTTVAQDIEAQAELATDTLIGMIGKKREAEVKSIETRFIRRESCGCAIDSSLTEEERESVAETLTREVRELRLKNATDNLLADRIGESNEFLLTCEDFSGFLDTLGRELLRFGFPGFWLALFDNPSDPSGNSRLHLAADGGAVRYSSDRGIEFPSWEIIPGGIRSFADRHVLFIIEALFSRNVNLGFMTFEVPDDGSVAAGRLTTSLRSQISGAIQSLRLLERGRLNEKRLAESEKLEALGGLVAGLAHELNTPIGVAISASSFLRGEACRLRGKFQDSTMTKSELDRALEGFIDAGGQIETTLSKTARLIQAFKKIAVDGESEHRERFDLDVHLRRCLKEFRMEHPEYDGDIQVRADSPVMVFSYPVTLCHIFSNLVSNSLTHGFSNPAAGLVSVSAKLERDSVTLTFSDEGCGIPEEDLKRVFEPFYTTLRGKGNLGLGLYVTRNLVMRILGGTISIESHAGRGTTVTVIFPAGE